MRLALTLLLSLPVFGQNTFPGGTGPGTSEMVTWFNGTPSGICRQAFAINVVNGSFYTCPVTSASTTWVCMGGADCPPIPSGANILITTGTCPSGYSENTGLDGYTVIGTLAAHSNVGQTGGSNNITPAGTNGTVSFTPTGTNSAPAFTGTPGTVPAQTFTGTPGTVPAQTFTGSSATTSSNSAGTPAGTNGASATTGNCAATNIAAGTNSTTACKATAPNLAVTAQVFTGSALAGHTHTLTATGTNGTAAFTPAGTNGTAAFTPAGTVAAPTFAGNAGTVPAETFTGASFDNRSAFTFGIFCQKN